MTLAAGSRLGPYEVSPLGGRYAQYADVYVSV
jgi:hypothetical protein